MLPYRKGFSQVQVELELASCFVLGDLETISVVRAECPMTCQAHPIYWVCTESLWEDAKPSKDAVAVGSEMNGSARFLG